MFHLWLPICILFLLNLIARYCCVLLQHFAWAVKYLDIQASAAAFLVTLALMDAPGAPLTGAALENGMTALKRGKTAMEKIAAQTKVLLQKVNDPNDEVFHELRQMVKTLLNSQRALDTAILMQEINDEPMTKISLQTFLQEQGALATKMAEKLAGCQARVRNR